MASSQSTLKSKDEDELVADPMKDVVKHMIQVHSKVAHADNQIDAYDDDAQGTFIHMVRSYDDDTLLRFTVQR